MEGELEQLGERIAEQAAHLDAAMHRLLADLRAFDERGGWHVQGALSCAHWLSWRVGWDLVTARERVRVARKLAEFPTIDDALRRGEVSYSKVRALVRVATPANEVLLLDHARLMTASQLEKLSRKYALVQRHGQDPHPVGDMQRRYVRRRDTEDGMVKIEAVLHPEEAELVWATLHHAATQLAREPASPGDDSAASRVAAPPYAAVVKPLPRDPTGEGRDQIGDSAAGDSAAGDSAAGDSAASRVDAPPHEAAINPLSQDPAGEGSDGIGDSAASGDVREPTSRPGGSVLYQRADAARRAWSRADALVWLAQGYLRGDRPDRSPIEITLTIPASSLRPETADPVEAGEMGESFVSGETARRLGCDAGVVELVEDEHGVPLSVGRKRRTISGALKRALYKRDSACTFPGCTHRVFLEGHHIKHWADGGETSLPNTALLCSTHHRYVHEYGYEIELGPDHRPRFRNPHGLLVTANPPRPVMTEFGWPRIRAANELLAIDANTIACGWDGKPVDYGTIVGHLVTADGRDDHGQRMP
jgi:hypothetical protein